MHTRPPLAGQSGQNRIIRTCMISRGIIPRRDDCRRGTDLREYGYQASMEEPLIMKQCFGWAAQPWRAGVRWKDDLPWRSPGEACKGSRRSPRMKEKNNSAHQQPAADSARALLHGKPSQHCATPTPQAATHDALSTMWAQGVGDFTGDVIHGNHANRVTWMKKCFRQVWFEKKKKSSWQAKFDIFTQK